MAPEPPPGKDRDPGPPENEDPGAGGGFAAGAMRRRKRGEKRARVERWREYDGTGALAGRNLPPDDTLAADQTLTALAVELRAAGLDGPLDYLRAVALIDQITGRDCPDPGTPARTTPARTTPAHPARPRRGQ